ncbi:hypothetical protein [Metalysinibacillus jejuensis]|uniref:hypothetical protein n=1 Tax=Metalysinibacillus jejuensis TaxID=914327 RepID=UPI000D35435F|nr:hypothetical protein [Metalysinibacillus jejuensis]
MKKCFLAFGILMGSIFGVSNIDVSAEENNKVEGNQLIENFKAKHPDWTFTDFPSEKAHCFSYGMKARSVKG